MRFLCFTIAILLLLVGCDYFDDSEDTTNPAVDGMAGEATDVVVIETQVSQEYPCPPLDRGDWTLLSTLPRDDFIRKNFLMPQEPSDAINQAYVDQKDFLFIIYRPAQTLDPPIWGNDRTGGTTNQARYYLENPGLLYNNNLIPKYQYFHFVDPNAFWFKHWKYWEEHPKAGLMIEFNAQKSEEQFLFNPKIGTTHNETGIGDGAPYIKQGYVLDIYTR